jgi:hypothetical protein
MESSAVLLAILLIGVAIYLWLHQTPDTIFLCTTYFDCPKRDSWAMFQNGINGILKYHSPETLSRIDKWIVINEYCQKPRKNWAKLVNEKYPFITFLQKSQQDEGQAKSLNILLSYIPKYKYMFHWEEGWKPTKPFLNESFRIMDSTDITQLQLTNDWMNGNETKKCKEDYCIIEYAKPAQELKTSEDVQKHWPLYSLRPSLNRVSFYTDLGQFSLKKFTPPFTSEYDYALRWYRKGGVKAVFMYGPLVRPTNYVSTHD